MAEEPGISARAVRLARDAGAISSIGASVGARLALFVAYLAMPLKRRLPLVGRAAIRLRVRIGGGTQAIRVSNATDMLVLKEILVEHIYDVDPDPGVETVVDLGANVGVASMLFAQRWPTARIVAVEPDPVTIRRLRANVASHPRVEVIEAALVGEERASVDFVVERGSWASRVAGHGERGTARVAALTLDQLMARLGLERIDLLKIDVEGMEHQILTPENRALDRVRMIVGEVHPNGTSGSETALLQALVEHGWRLVRPLERQSFCLRAPTRAGPPAPPGASAAPGTAAPPPS